MANPRRRTARVGRSQSGGRPIAARPRDTGNRKPSLADRARYGFDNTMSRGTPALVGWLAVVTVVLVAIFTAAVLIGGLAPEADDGTRKGVVGQAFSTFLHALDPGTVAGDTGSWQFLATMFLVTIGGLFVVSALIGVIATGLDNKIQELRKGRSFVIESDHTLILGWSETIYTILSELMIANESRKKPVVVILAERDRVEMEDLIRAKLGGTGSTRVVCRSGSAIDLSDLAVVNPQASRSIIVLSPEGDDPDAQVIKTVLAVTQGPERREEPYRIVAEIQDAKNLEAARLVGGDEAVIVDKAETIARLIVQTSRQSGLSAAYTELLDFDGDEIYFNEDPALVGSTFAQAQHAYEECTVIGIQEAGGRVRLNAPADRPIAAGERVIAIAEDDHKLVAAGAGQAAAGTVDEELIVHTERGPAAPQHTLLLGWNKRAPLVIKELDQYVTQGSTVTAVADWAPAASRLEQECGDLANITVSFHKGDTTERGLLESLRPEDHDQAVVLCYSDILDAQHADARTLVTLLHLRDIAGRTGTAFTVTSEMLDDRNRQLAEVTQVDDVIVSDKLISLMLTQISENPHLTAVFDELFTAEGSELYMRPVEEYLAPGARTTFRTLVEAAQRRGEVAVGYRLAALSGPEAVTINPPKSQAIELGEGDRVVVLAED